MKNKNKKSLLTASMKKVFALSFFAILFSCIVSDVIGETKNATATATVTAATMMPTFSRPAYYKNNGDPVLDIKALTGGDTAPTVIVDGKPKTLQSCSCNDERAFQAPSSFTLVAVNATGAPVTYKFTDAFSMVEAFRGSIGAAWVSVKELRFGDGTLTDQQGEPIFGAQSLAAYFASMPLAIEQTIVTGSGVSGANQAQTFDIQFYTANLNGVKERTRTHSAATIANSALIQMISEKELWYFTPNKALSFIVPANSAINIQFICAGMKPIDEAL